MTAIKSKHNFDGFTLVELLMALVVAGIIFAAVAAMAYALGTANDIANDMVQKQAQVRYITVRLSELIRHCKLICDTQDNGITIWKEDNDGDNEIDINEMVYIEAGENRDHIQLRESNVDPVVLIPQCSNVHFQFDELSLPPMKRKFVSISFDLIENGISRRYQISATLRGWAGNLLNEAGDAVVSDDD